MKNINKNPITTQAIKDYLSSQDSFDLELSICREARSFDFQVNHGGLYIDPVTKKARQYDIRASIEREYNKIDLAIECKSLSISNPLVISRIPRSNRESFLQIVQAFDSQQTNLDYEPTIMPSGNILTNKSLTSLYKENEMVGKSLVQVKMDNKNPGLIQNSGDSETYNKWAQAISSAAELVSNASFAHETHRVKKINTFIAPALVVANGTLWVADYSEKGVLKCDPYQTDEAYLFIDYLCEADLHHDYRMSHLHIYTKKGIFSLLQELHEESEIWDSVFPPTA